MITYERSTRSGSKDCTIYVRYTVQHSEPVVNIVEIHVVQIIILEKYGLVQWGRLIMDEVLISYHTISTMLYSHKLSSEMRMYCSKILIVLPGNDGSQCHQQYGSI
jgi:hypothetical protein